MKKFVLYTIPEKRIPSIFFLGILCTLNGMDYKPADEQQSQVPQLQKQEHPIFQKSIKIWDNEKLINDGEEFGRSVPKNMIITPDEKGILFTKPGAVFFVSKENTMEKDPFSVLRHSDSRYYPMIAAALKQDQSLLVVSVLNKAKEECECMLASLRFRKKSNVSHDVFSAHHLEYLHANSDVQTIGFSKDWNTSNVQAIALSSNGEYLAIAFLNCFQITDLVTKTSYRSKFLPSPTDSFVVDISAPVDNFLEQKAQHVAAVNDKGIIDCKKVSTMNTSTDHALRNIKSVSTGDRIENIYLMPNIKEIWYVTETGDINTVDFRIFLEHCDSAIKKRLVSHLEGSKASVDQGLEKATVHWVNNPQTRLKVDVYRENDTNSEKFSIEMPKSLPASYNFISAEGQKKSLPTYILRAAIRGNCLAVLTPDGCVHFWQLPEKQRKPTDEEVRGDCKKEVLTRKRSFSIPGQSPDGIRKFSKMTPLNSGNEKRKSSKAVPKLHFPGSRESIRSQGSPRKKSGTPRNTKSIPSSNDSGDEIKMETIPERDFVKLLQDDLQNNFNRGKKENS